MTSNYTEAEQLFMRSSSLGNISGKECNSDSDESYHSIPKVHIMYSEGVSLKVAHTCSGVMLN